MFLWIAADLFLLSSELAFASDSAIQAVESESFAQFGAVAVITLAVHRVSRQSNHTLDNDVYSNI